MPFSDIKKNGDHYTAVMTTKKHDKYGIISGYLKQRVIIPINQPKPSAANGLHCFLEDGSALHCAGFRMREDGTKLDPEYIKLRSNLKFRKAP